MPRRSAIEENPLKIDRAGAAEVPLSPALQEWGSEKRVFISSVMSELPDERREAANAIRAMGARAVMFEDFGGRDQDAEEAYLGEVESSDIYLGILGKRYGKPLKSRFSATHSEYLHAEKHGLRIAVWTVRGNGREGHEQAFLDELRTFYVVPEFSSTADLGRQVEERLKGIAAEDLAPWCKLGNFVFRATEVKDRGKEIEVYARVRSDEVAHGLEELRPGQWGSGEGNRFTWQGRSRFVRVRTLETTTTSARSRLLRLGLETTEPPGNNFVEFSMGGFGPNDITDAVLRAALFGEPNPLARQNMGFICEFPDPLAALRSRPVSEESVRPIAELLLTDELVGSGRAARIASFKLGVAIRGRRRCSLAWEPPRRYSNESTRIRSLEGLVDL